MSFNPFESTGQPNSSSQAMSSNMNMGSNFIAPTLQTLDADDAFGDFEGSTPASGAQKPSKDDDGWGGFADAPDAT